MVRATFTGDADLVSRMGALSVELRRAGVLEAVQAAAEPMREQMAQAAPRGPDAPHIADNIKVSVLRQVDGVALAEGAAAVAIGPSKDFFYGWFWEFGWKFHPGRAFVRPTYEALKDRAQSIIGRSLWATVTAALR